MAMNKKGMDISLNFIILAVLALIALIIIALFFTGGLTNLFKQTAEVGTISAEKVALYKTRCDFYCATNDKSSWCNPQLPEEFAAADPAITNCEELYGDDLEKGWSEDECVDASTAGASTVC